MLPFEQSACELERIRVAIVIIDGGASFRRHSTAVRLEIQTSSGFEAPPIRHR